MVKLLLVFGLALLQGGCVALRYGVPAFVGAGPMQEFLVELPPIDLPAETGHASAAQPPPVWVTFPVRGWAHGFSIDLVDAEGRRVPDVLLHHVKLLDPSQRELFSPLTLRLVGAGAETRLGMLPPSLGFPLEPGDSLLVTAMVHNPTAASYAGVRLRVRMHYTRVEGRRPATTAFPFFLHVTPPAQHSGFDLPPGRSEWSRETTPAVPGRIVALGGHLHRYGVEVRLEDATSGRVLWRTRARRDAEGQILELPRSVFTWRRGITLRPDRRYRVVAVYDNPTGRIIPDGGMGTLGGVIVPAGPWPPVDRRDPLYVADLTQELAGEHHHHHR